MFDSPESASLWFDIFNGVLFAGALLVTVGTWGTIKTAGIKERFSDERIAANEAETKRAIADSDIAKESAAKANESAARLNNETARLQADNLALQTVLLPRNVGSIGFDKPPMAATWFAGMEQFKNTEFFIQLAVGDSEARNLANEISIVLSLFGLKATVDENRTASPQIPDGVSVSYPIGKAWTAEAPNQPWFEWHKAAEALANALLRPG